MRDINQFTITEAVKASFKTAEGSRLKFLLKAFIDHLHDYTREVNLTHDEWIGILNFLYDCGQISTPERHEFILLSDVLGFSALVDMVNTRGGATEGSNLGPFYLDDAPLNVSTYFGNGTGVPDLDPGEDPEQGSGRIYDGGLPTLGGSGDLVLEGC
mgnify:CR=1 FL=1